MTPNCFYQADISAGWTPPEEYDAVYTDPPWGLGNYRYWHTMAGLDRPSEENYESLLRTVARLVSFAPLGGFVETGLRFESELTAIFEEKSLAPTGRWITAYGSPKRPNVVLRFGDLDCPDLSGMGGVALVVSALGSLSAGSRVLDPCVGLGNTVAAARRLGLSVTAADINAARLSRAASR